MQEIRFTGELDYTVNNIGFVRVLRNENYRVSYKNGKNRCGLIMVAEGEVEFYFTATKKSVRLGGGAVLFIPKNYPYHATYMQNNTMARVIDFDLNSEDIPLLFREPIYKSGNIFASICHELSGEDAKSITFLVSKIYELLYILEKTNEVVPDRFRKLIPALEEVREQYAENKKVSCYAQLCHMSESNFRKLFKEYTGMTLIEYRNCIRIAEAKRMIDSREFTVAEAAYLTGFHNMSFFYNVLHKYASRK